MKRNIYAIVLSSKKFFSLLVISMVLVGSVAKAQSYTMFGTTAPAGAPGGNANNNDFPTFTPIQGIETGIRFKVTQLGTISAIRFYKGTANTGTHIGNLWTPSISTVTPTRTVTFTGETASGWQEMAFGTPLTVTPGVVYVASVFSPTGTYNAENTINPSIDENDPPFIILAGDGNTDPSAIGNGSYIYTATSAFPNLPNGSGYFSTNFFIDVLFTPTFPLPVNITDLRASTVSKDVTVAWSTRTETNNKGFELQRSNNGADWYPVTFVTGAGESTTTLNYSHVDKNLAPGLYYYRLKQVDFDGKSKTTNVVTATVGGKGKVSLYFANPMTGSGTIRYDLPVAQKVRLSIVDMAGREVKVLANKKGEVGSHLVSISTDGLGRQVYFVRLQTENGVITNKLVIQ